MLEYRLDDLHWSEFESLCQALLKAKLGVGVEAWGGSGDWGNDAYCQASLCYPGDEIQQGPFQFQAKFIQGANAAGAKPTPLLIQAVSRECQRIKKRNQPPPQVYSLLTNVVLSTKLREAVVGKIQHALPDCAAIIAHGGNDICSWLHMHEDIVRMFPQLLSHRNLSELVRQAVHGDVGKKTVAMEKPELSSALKKKKKQASDASRKHDIDSALRLWSAVRKQAEKEGNKGEEIRARLESVLVLAREEPNLDEALKLADECLQDAKAVDLGDDRCLLLQLIGEVHRIKGNRDQARGFITRALEYARETGSQRDEGFALLSLSALEKSGIKNGDNTKALELVELAYNAFSELYATGDNEKQKSAKEGFAQCHCWKAEIFGYTRPYDAITEWTRALEFYKNFGKGWEWNIADMLLQRANLRRGTDEYQLAAADLNDAAKLFEQINNTVGLAKCYLQVGELFDSVGKRDAAANYYQQAAAIAAAWKNDRKASYYYFRHACKLVELRKYEEAEQIFNFLVSNDWLEQKHKLTVFTMLCLVAKGTEKEELLKEKSKLALELIDGLIQEAKSVDEMHRLLIQKGAFLEQIGQYDQAIHIFKKAIERLEGADDIKGVIECWNHIRGVMQQLKDRKKEREAAEKILALGAEKISPMLAAMTLTMLAQLNIDEQKFSEAKQQLDRAEELDPENPAVAIISADLRSKLPKLSSPSQLDVEQHHRPPQRDLPELIQELHEWCICYPKMRMAILPLWYYIHRNDLWSIFRSMLGIKFLICSVNIGKFERVKKGLCGQGDLYVWGTNFCLKSKGKAEIIPVTKGFIFPAGIKVLSNNQGSNTSSGTSGKMNLGAEKAGLLAPIKDIREERYFLAFLKGVEGFPDASPFFGGGRFRLDPKIVKFMLNSSANDLLTNRRICLPLTEREAIPNLLCTMQVAWKNGAIPVFSEHLPHDDEIRCICDSTLDLPTGQADVAACSTVKEIWGELLSSCSETPVVSLTNFKKDMGAVLSAAPIGCLPARVYMLRFRVGDQEVVYPAMVMGLR